MKNYICINGKKTELPKEFLEEVMQSRRGKATIDGDIVTLSDGKEKYEFIVLDRSKDTVALLLKDLLVEEIAFGSNNDYRGSKVEAICDDFAKVIERIVGAENLIEHTVDLTADDGLKDYGKIRKKMSLLTSEKARRFVDKLDKYKLDEWWWLSTPYSTVKHNDTTWVKCVSPSGGVNFDCSHYRYFGVRPFCILKSNIFVSK